jgi:hypothetical protein
VWNIAIETPGFRRRYAFAKNSEDPRYGGIRVAHQMSSVGIRSDSL